MKYSKEQVWKVIKDDILVTLTYTIAYFDTCSTLRVQYNVYPEMCTEAAAYLDFIAYKLASNFDLAYEKIGENEGGVYVDVILTTSTRFKPEEEDEDEENDGQDDVSEDIAEDIVEEAEFEKGEELIQKTVEQAEVVASLQGSVEAGVKITMDALEARDERFKNIEDVIKFGVETSLSSLVQSEIEDVDKLKELFADVERTQIALTLYLNKISEQTFLDQLNRTSNL